MVTKKNTFAPDVPLYLRPAAMKYLRALVRANRKDPVEAREWFLANKATYEAELKQPMLGIIRHVTNAMLEFAPEHVRPADKSFFRIYRDTRFSNDKRPYKEHVAAWWAHGALEKTSGAGFYFHISPTEVILAAGAYMPEKEQLAAIRHWLLDHHEELRAELEGKALRKHFELFEGNALTRPPKGFPAEHAGMDLIRCRQWGVSATLPVEAALEPGLAENIVQHFRLAAPLVGLLNEPIVESLTPRKPLIFGLSGGVKPAKTR